jgi:fibrillarin-like pre-rRNA processing protein
MLGRNGLNRKIRKVKIKGEYKIATKNLVPGHQVYGENLIDINGEEFRIWDPFRSKLAASLLLGLRDLPISEGDKVLYLGVSTGTTASHVSDILGSRGTLFAVEVAPRVAREFVEHVAIKRKNIIPIIEDARKPDMYFSVYDKVNTVYCDIAQSDQTDIALINCGKYLLKGGFLILIIKTRSINTLKEPNIVIREEVKKVETWGFSVNQIMSLNQYDKDHAIVSAIWL